MIELTIAWSTTVLQMKRERTISGWNQVLNESIPVGDICQMGSVSGAHEQHDISAVIPNL